MPQKKRRNMRHTAARSKSGFEWSSKSSRMGGPRLLRRSKRFERLEMSVNNMRLRIALANVRNGWKADTDGNRLSRSRNSVPRRTRGPPACKRALAERALEAMQYKK